MSVPEKVELSRKVEQKNSSPKDEVIGRATYALVGLGAGYTVGAGGGLALSIWLGAENFHHYGKPLLCLRLPLLVRF